MTGGSRAVASPVARGGEVSRASRSRIAIPWLLLAVAVLTVACTPASAPPSPAASPPVETSSGAGSPSAGSPGARQVATGIVVSVEGGLGATSSFTLRTVDGQQLVFRVAQVELDGDAFPPQHLREHQASAEAVSVTYERRGDELVAVRLEDAP